MAEKKNIVIKLKYPTGQTHGKNVPAPKVITEWNYKRIAFALVGIASLAAVAVYFLSIHPVQNTVPPLPAVQPVVSAPVVSPEPSNTAPPAPPAPPAQTPINEALKKKVLRAQLTSKIIDSEPAGEVSLPLQASEKIPVAVYYFAELTDMKGKTVFHEWLLDDKLVSKKVVNISDKTWRTSSRQMIAYTTNSNWTVRLVDEAGQVLSEQQFTVALAK